MHELTILMTFAGGLGAALIFGYIAHRLKLSPIVGYLLAGVVVGPFTPGFIADQAIAEQFAEIGVILLLFGVGLRFNLRELFAVWHVAVPGAFIQSSLSTLLLAVLLHLAGWDWTSGIILGIAISVASTVVMALVLAEHHDLHAPIGNIAVGWTVVEDLITVAVMLVLPIIFDQSVAQASVGSALGLTVMKVIGLIAIVIVLGRWVMPWLLERVAATRSRELFTLAVLALAVGVAIGSAKIFGISIALGAFLAGVAVGRSEFAARAGNDALPMRDAFAVLFFVSIGMLFDPQSILESPLVIVAILAVVIVGKPLTAMLTVRMLGVPTATALPVGAAFAQVGEFSFILGTVARQLGLIDTVSWSALVAASIISIGLNPTIYRAARRFSTKPAPSPQPARAERHRNDPWQCILVGYGPVGQTVHGILTDRGASVTVIELNLGTVRLLRSQERPVLYGDVLRSGTLEEAGIGTAGHLIISSDVDNAAEIVRMARALNSDVHIIVRCSHLRDAAGLYAAGADVVAAGEAEVAIALAEFLISDDKIEHALTVRQRQELRDRLYHRP